MVVLGIIISGLWLGIGMMIGWGRSKAAYQIEFARTSQIPEATPSQAKRNAQEWACAVFFGWTVAGLVGAVLWLILWAFLILGQAEVEARSKPSSRKNISGDLLSGLLLGGLFLITAESLQLISEKADEFVIKLAVAITFLSVVVALAVVG